jgi:RNA polymerase sigma-70 factor (ECF subfamily)
VEDVHRLTGAIASGDPEAFARLYRAKFPHVFAVARKVTGFDEDSCLDVVQDAMMRVIRYMRSFDDEGALNKWLARVTRSVAIDHLRRERRRRIRECVAVDRTVHGAPDDVQEIQERLEWVRRELHGLDRATVEMIELRFRAGLTLASIGQRLGLGAGAVHGRLNRAIARLRQRACNDD